MVKLKAYFAFIVLLIVAACGDWPPSETKARKHLVENRESFERLAEKMRSTDYWRVSIHPGPNVQVTPSPGGPYEDSFVIDDDPEWYELLSNVGMFMVLQSNDGAVQTDPAYLWGSRENQAGHNGFTHDLNMLQGYKMCQPDYEKIPCGQCAVTLEDDWFIHYIWHPDFFSRNEWESAVNGEIPMDEYYESYDKALRECLIDGYTEIGYDPAMYFNIEGS